MDLDQLLDGLTLSKLQKIFESVMKRREDKIDPVRSTFGTIKKETGEPGGKDRGCAGNAERHRRFSRGMLPPEGQDEIVVTFLALLELMKMGRIHLTQEHLFDDMMIEALEPEGPGTRLGPGGGNRMRVEDLRGQEAVGEAVLFTMGRSVEIRQLAAALKRENRRQRLPQKG